VANISTETSSFFGRASSLGQIGGDRGHSKEERAGKRDLSNSVSLSCMCEALDFRQIQNCLAKCLREL
jgi:hypothetical protein